MQLIISYKDGRSFASDGTDEIELLPDTFSTVLSCVAASHHLKNEGHSSLLEYFEGKEIDKRPPGAKNKKGKQNEF